MTRKAAFFWVGVGTLVVVLDAILSMQSLVGIMEPPNLLWYLGAAGFGTALTGAAVLFPVHLKLARTRTDRKSSLNDPMTILTFLGWGVVAVFDIFTSVVGAIWYGQLKMPLNSPVDFSQVSFDLASTFVTSSYVGVVFFVAFVCFQFGVALDTLRVPVEKESRDRHVW